MQPKNSTNIYQFFPTLLFFPQNNSTHCSPLIFSWLQNPAHQPPPPPQASESQLKETLLNLASPNWTSSAGPRRYQLKFDAEETCYLLKGRVKAYPKGSSEAVEFGAGDLVTIPKGLSCTWDVSVAVDKHYKFESSSSSS
ncbi:unnamed protein product [Prunus armeniaca]|uniref:(S)-ureidoglycine aminohydrolase cupin domain-containing protein n=1 Tax=Prunus armeniaca TaxID=36596 RepID=A0A6J5VQ48_PRUAR|nr:unnamed protein product [Prunus armeniaca]CAB4321703.1 unnamed protein product [Prunus armeniaca]